MAREACSHWRGRGGHCQVSVIAPAGKTGLGEGGDLGCDWCQEGEEEEEKGGGEEEGRDEEGHPRPGH